MKNEKRKANTNSVTNRYFIENTINPDNIELSIMLSSESRDKLALNSFPLPVRQSVPEIF